jgi:hypothetical protein
MRRPFLSKKTINKKKKKNLFPFPSKDIKTVATLPTVYPNVSPQVKADMSGHNYDFGKMYG